MNAKSQFLLFAYALLAETKTLVSIFSLPMEGEKDGQPLTGWIPDDSWCTPESTSSFKNLCFLISATKTISAHVKTKPYWKSSSTAHTARDDECRLGLRIPLSRLWLPVKPSGNMQLVASSRSAAVKNGCFSFIYTLLERRNKPYIERRDMSDRKLT